MFEETIQGLNLDTRRRFSKLAFTDTSSSRTVTPADIVNDVPQQSANWISANYQQSDRKDMVVIHVCDQIKNINRDFHCRKDLLVKYMKYFECYFTNDDEEMGYRYEEIDISVNCDVDIFEWLMNYIHNQDNPPVISKSIVTSILISSDFLQMEELVDKCLDFFSTNLNDIIRLPLDLSCISERLIHRLALLTNPTVSKCSTDAMDDLYTPTITHRYCLKQRIEKINS